MLITASLPQKTLNVLFLLRLHLSTFFLAGGTALALYFQHRNSEDLDFFSSEPFNAMEFSAFLKKREIKIVEVAIEPGTLHCSIENVNVSFFVYEYPILGDFVLLDHLKVASIVDIAAMKLSAILGRAEKKDYFDIAEILQHYELSDILNVFNKKYGQEIDLYFVLKSLCYFEDVEESPLPSAAVRTWDWVKRQLIDSTAKYLL